jgi:hypothetical protein
MRVLYVASNPEGSSTLKLESEITELQKATAQSGVSRTQFIFLPALPFEDIETQVAIYKPDILHLSCHGDDGALRVADSTLKSIDLSAEALELILAPTPPRLVYLNACKSQAVAERLVASVDFAIGTDESITNFAARKGAVTFYRNLLRGCTLEQAFNSSSATVGVLSTRAPKKVTTKLFERNIGRRSLEKFYEPTSLVARFERDLFKCSASGYRFRLGLVGCAADTVQVVFCTDDETFVGDNLEEDLCSVVRSTSVRGEVWLGHTWDGVSGDTRVYALATTAGGECYSLSSTLLQALDRFYRVYYSVSSGEKYPADLQVALKDLAANDGAAWRPLQK